ERSVMGVRAGRLGRWWLLALLLALLLHPSAPAAAGVCTGFRPTRHDMRGAPPILARPIAAIPGDFNRDGLVDVAVVNKFIAGTFQNGSISLLIAASDGHLTVASTQVIEGFSQWAASGDFNEDDVPDVVAVTVDSALLFLGDGTGGFQPQVRI